MKVFQSQSANVENTLSTRKNPSRFSELLKSWHFRSTRFLPCSDDILSCCGSLVCEWEHLAIQRECVCVFVNRCALMYTMTQTHSIPARSLVYETPHTIHPPPLPPPSGPIQHRVQRALRLATNGDPLPVLSPFNDWISSRLPSSRVIAWWSARCCARAGGSAWQSVLVLAWMRGVSRNSCSGSFRSHCSDSHSPGFSHWGGTRMKRRLVVGEKKG